MLDFETLKMGSRAIYSNNGRKTEAVLEVIHLGRYDSLRIARFKVISDPDKAWPYYEETSIYNTSIASERYMFPAKPTLKDYLLHGADIKVEDICP